MTTYTTQIDTVRLLIADTATPQLLTDDQLDAFLVLESGNIKRAAANALDTIATSETLVSKKITENGLTTDGPAVAAALRAQAKSLRDQADIDMETVGWSFDVVEFDIYGSPEYVGSQGFFPHEPF